MEPQSDQWINLAVIQYEWPLTDFEFVLMRYLMNFGQREDLPLDLTQPLLPLLTQCGKDGYETESKLFGTPSKKGRDM
jgi:hypothetical protein